MPVQLSEDDLPETAVIARKRWSVKAGAIIGLLFFFSSCSLAHPFKPGVFFYFLLEQSTGHVQV